MRIEDSKNSTRNTGFFWRRLGSSAAYLARSADMAMRNLIHSKCRLEFLGQNAKHNHKQKVNNNNVHLRSSCRSGSLVPPTRFKIFKIFHIQELIWMKPSFLVKLAVAVGLIYTKPESQSSHHPGILLAERRRWRCNYGPHWLSFPPFASSTHHHINRITKSQNHTLHFPP